MNDPNAASVKNPPTAAWTVGQVASLVFFVLYLVTAATVDLVMLLGDLSLNDPIPAGVVFGATFAQSVVIAVYFAWGGQPLLQRGIIACCGLACTGWCISRSFQGVPPDIVVTLMILVPSAIALANALPMLVMRVAYGLRLCLPRDMNHQHDNRYQFGIRQLLIATGVVAVVMGIARVSTGSFSQDLTSGGDDLAEMLLIIGILLVFSVVTSWICVVFCLATRVLWLLVAVVALSALFTYLELVAFHWVTGRSTPDVICVFTTLQGVQLLGTAWPLLALRGLGLRLARGR